MSRLHEAARQSAAEQRDRFAAIPTVRMFDAIVKTVATAAAADGVHATVTVTWNGGDYLAASYDDGTYTPGDVVVCALFKQQLRILSRQVGFP
jgi:hypothetical protein